MLHTCQEPGPCGGALHEQVVIAVVLVDRNCILVLIIHNSILHRLRDTPFGFASRRDITSVLLNAEVPQSLIPEEVVLRVAEMKLWVRVIRQPALVPRMARSTKLFLPDEL